MPKRSLPYVICHMAPSVDGRITGMGSLRSLSAAYERTAQTFDADGWIIGRVSMEPYAGKTRVPRRKVRSRIPRKDFISSANAESYAIAIDPSGKLTWKSNAIDGEHVITILSERVTDDYLAFLQSKRVSYLFGGKTKIDLPKALAKLRGDFGIKTLLLEGGGKINGAFLDAGLIDELSILIAPLADGSVGTPTLFDVEKRRGPRRELRLISVQPLEDDIVWLRYQMKD
jgi:2,5-diamino-6-(ribosylamino)-4(3H)-pyrimidinone 5'-phosphate reductase